MHLIFLKLFTCLSSRFQIKKGGNPQGKEVENTWAARMHRDGHCTITYEPRHTSQIICRKNGLKSCHTVCACNWGRFLQHKGNKWDVQYNPVHDNIYLKAQYSADVFQVLKTHSKAMNARIGGTLSHSAFTTRSIAVHSGQQRSGRSRAMSAHSSLCLKSNLPARQLKHK